MISSGRTRRIAQNSRLTSWPKRRDTSWPHIIGKRPSGGGASMTWHVPQPIHERGGKRDALGLEGPELTYQVISSGVRTY